MSFLNKPANAEVAYNTVSGITQPVLSCPFTEGSGTAIDNLGGSGGINWDGTINGTPAWTTTEGGGLEIDTTTEFVAFNSVPPDSTYASGTVMVRFKPTGTAAAMALFSGGLTVGLINSLVISYNSFDGPNGNIAIRVRISTEGATVHAYQFLGAFTAGDTMTLFIRWNATTVTCRLFGANATPTTRTTADSVIMTGVATPPFTGKFAAGQLCEIRFLGFWSSELTNAECALLEADPYMLVRRKAPLDVEAPMSCRMTSTGVSLFLTTESGDTTVRDYRILSGTDGVTFGTTSATQSSSGSATPQRLEFVVAAEADPSYAHAQYRLTHTTGAWYDLCGTAATDGSTAGLKNIATYRKTTSVGRSKSDPLVFAVSGDLHSSDAASPSNTGYTRLRNAVTAAVTRGAKFWICLGDLIVGLPYTPLTGLASTAASGHLVLTDALNRFTADMTGVTISAGTNFTLGSYVISTFNDAGSVTLAAPCGSGGDASGGTAKAYGSALTNLEWVHARIQMRPITDAMPLYLVSGNWDVSNDSPGGAAQVSNIAAMLKYFGNPPNLSALESYWLFENGDLCFTGMDCYSNTLLKTIAGWQLDDVGTDPAETQRSAINAAMLASARSNKMRGAHQTLGGTTDYGRCGPGAVLQTGTYQKDTLHPDMKVEGTSVEFFGHDHIAAAAIVDGVIYAEAGTPTNGLGVDAAGIGYTAATGCNLLEGQKPYCILIVSVWGSGFKIDYVRTTAGLTDDGLDGVTPANEVIATYETPQQGSAGGRLALAGVLDDD